MAMYNHGKSKELTVQTAGHVLDVFYEAHKHDKAIE